MGPRPNATTASTYSHNAHTTWLIEHLCLLLRFASRRTSQSSCSARAFDTKKTRLQALPGLGHQVWQTGAMAPPVKTKLKAAHALLQQGSFTEALNACEELLKATGPSYEALL